MLFSRNSGIITVMVVTLHKSGDTFSFTLPPQAEKELALIDGSSVDIKPAEDTPVIRYMSVEEGLKAYEETRLDNDYAYRELAR